MNLSVSVIIILFTVKSKCKYYLDAVAAASCMDCWPNTVTLHWIGHQYIFSRCSKRMHRGETWIVSNIVETISHSPATPACEYT